VEGDYREKIWYKEREIVASFYHHLRSDGEFSKIYEKCWLIPILEYNPKPRDDVKNEIQNSGIPLYPKPKSGEQLNHNFDLVFIKFSEDPHNREKYFGKWWFSYLNVEHVRLVAMEFKVNYPSHKKWPSYKEDFKKDLQNLEKLIETYNTKLCYFCFIAEELLELPELETKENEEKFRIAYGLCDKSEWDIVPLAEYRTLSEHGK
jgi:hypothetical protein